MQLFFTTDIRENLAFLKEEEARHCSQVLRKKVDSPITLIDGKGGWYEGLLIEVGKKECIVSIQKAVQAYNQRTARLHLAIAPPKNIARFEWFLEKTTELGIDEITPLLCERSERKKIRLDRLEKILLSAMKQSLKAYLPKLNDWVKLQDFVQQENPNTEKYIAHCDYENNIHLKEKYTKGNDVIIMVGPEGDFSPKEVNLALEKGFSPIGLGKNRLRTETAGIAACHTINLLNEL